jgi:hypothetical protein
MPRRLTKIDELTSPDHYRLEASDDCYFIGEYTPRAGYNHSATNDLILNLKKEMDRRHLPEWRYKTWAIEQASKQLREVLPPDTLEEATFIPVPPSKAKTDPLYDDRVVQILSGLGEDVDVRDAVTQGESYDPSHALEVRLGPDELYQLYELDDEYLEPLPTSLVIVDDVLTTGAHFKAMKRLLNEAFPEVPIIGVFVARRVLPHPVVPVAPLSTRR